MKTSLVVLAAVGSVAAADLPDCAQTCVSGLTSGSSIGDCSSLDIECICSGSDWLNEVACCLSTSCDEEDQQSAISYAESICSTAGVTVPDSVVCNSTTTTNSTSTNSSATATTTTTSATASVTNAASNLMSGSASILGAILAAWAFL